LGFFFLKRREYVSIKITNLDGRFHEQKLKNKAQSIISEIAKLNRIRQKGKRIKKSTVLFGHENPSPSPSPELAARAPLLLHPAPPSWSSPAAIGPSPPTTPAAQAARPRRHFSSVSLSRARARRGGHGKPAKIQTQE
jgi:hypothetical protein